ncbi:MAG: cupin domain-containing protein [Solirubrobacterales bacterium]|nr:cupin domain-containing protein [Solirubrobacterales bacterium]MCO5327239.1 cupin domain-containing protein [Solirubrobacterales bacterium]
MGTWAKSNFTEIEGRDIGDSAVHAVFSRKELDSPELGVSRFTFPPGERFPFAHRHRSQSESYVVVAGSGRMKLGDEIVELAQWDVLRVDPDVGRQIEAGPDGLDVICIGGSRPDGGDGELVEDFWD